MTILWEFDEKPPKQVSAYADAILGYLYPVAR